MTFDVSATAAVLAVTLALLFRGRAGPALVIF